MSLQLPSIAFLNKEALNYFYLLLLFSVPVFLLLLAAGISNYSAGLLLSASAPGAIVWPLIIGTNMLSNPGGMSKFLLPMLILFPASWALPVVAFVQAWKLRDTSRSINLSDCFKLAGIAALYFLTAATNQLEW